jgi:hypothetical protein
MEFFREVDHTKVQPKRANDVDGIGGTELVENRVDLRFFDALWILTTLTRQRA